MTALDGIFRLTIDDLPNLVGRLERAKLTFTFTCNINDADLTQHLQENAIKMTSPRTNQTPSVSGLPWRILKAGNKTGAQ